MGSSARPTAAPIIPNNCRASSALFKRQSSDLSKSSERKDESFAPLGARYKHQNDDKRDDRGKDGCFAREGQVAFLSIASLIFFSVASSVLLSLSVSSDI